MVSEAEHILLSIFLRTELRWDYSAPLGGMFQGVGLCVGGEVRGCGMGGLVGVIQSGYILEPVLDTLTT